MDAFTIDELVLLESTTASHIRSLHAEADAATADGRSAAYVRSLHARAHQTRILMQKVSTLRANAEMAEHAAAHRARVAAAGA